MEAADIRAGSAESAESGIDWEIEYKRSLPGVYRYFACWVGDRSLAEDLTSATFERAWSSRRNFDLDRGQVMSWLLGIARNVKADHFRGLRENEPLNEASGVSPIRSVEEAVQLNSDFDRLYRHLRQLAEREQELIALKYGAALNNRQIAKLTGLTETNVGTILHRVVHQIRTQWEERS